MMQLHDVWVNWFEGEENGYNVCHFHEWRRDDGIELLDQVPLLYITEALFDYIENDMLDLPKEMLDMMYKRAYVKKGQERHVLDYACVITDGANILALDTIGYHIPIRKSRLIPRQEQLVFEMIKKSKVMDFSFKRRSHQKEYHILSMPPELAIGLTRRERQLKHVMMMGLDQLRTANNIEELRYWLTEWNPKKYPYLRMMDADAVWKALYNGVKHGWSKEHEELCEKLVKGQPFLERMWEIENAQHYQNARQKSRNQ
ncbi:DUF3603 family protein [Ornithinibacillus gellani]|uniref:YjbA family protein n=1 Tax=Ornithinibacillus gellani TaxID=2293253 RepID=UPI000F48D1B8|nr:YjbA family protein [Ornithinibacillus gellani]TQS75814.1 DUF3603 family protein [Ornithinibacillus gellani]